MRNWNDVVRFFMLLRLLTDGCGWLLERFCLLPLFKNRTGRSNKRSKSSATSFPSATPAMIHHRPTITSNHAPGDISCGIQSHAQQQRQQPEKVVEIVSIFWLKLSPNQPTLFLFSFLFPLYLPFKIKRRRDRNSIAINSAYFVFRIHQ